MLKFDIETPHAAFNPSKSIARHASATLALSFCAIGSVAAYAFCCASVTSNFRVNSRIFFHANAKSASPGNSSTFCRISDACVCNKRTHRSLAILDDTSRLRFARWICICQRGNCVSSVSKATFSAFDALDAHATRKNSALVAAHGFLSSSLISFSDKSKSLAYNRLTSSEIHLSNACFLASFNAKMW